MNRYLMQLLRLRTIVQADGEGQGGAGVEASEADPKAGQVTSGEPHGDPESEDVDWKAMSRKWEERAKANKQAAEELEKLKEAQMSQQEKEAKHAKELEAELAQYKAEKQQAEWCRTVSKDTGIPADLLRGSTLEEIQAHADSLKQYLQENKTDTQAETGTAAGYAPSVGTTPGKRGSVPLDEQIKEAEKNKDLNKVMLLKAMTLGNQQTR